MRKFEKISLSQLQKDTNNLCLEDIKLPGRATVNSAGYDFYLLEDITLKPKEIKKIPTGVKVSMNDGEALILIVRSSVGFKHNIRLTNQVGLIDKDYYNNQNNEGHMWFSVQNESDEVKKFKKHDRLIQGIFINFLTVENEKKRKKERIGGLGSTDGDRQ
jgi:dUTP pyrophosphatase